MLQLGFDERWVQLIMECVTTVSYKIKVNGELTNEITPSRGLRQGDPLSPYLFLICAEGFSSLLNAAEGEGKLQGLSICAGAPSITHLLFADDSLLLMKVNQQNAIHLQNVLQLYETCSGQTINKEKSSVCFSKNCGETLRNEFLNSLGISQEAKSERYLGLPVYMGRSKTQMFNYLKDRVWKRIQGWKMKLLSSAGKDTLIKAIAQAIPTYAMSCFDLTKNLCDEISRMICRYWWSQQDKERKIHWVAWPKMSSRKEKGGLGYRDLHLFNLAMLARQAWRLIQVPDSLCARLLKARYRPYGDLVGAREGPGISYSWRSLLRGLKALENGIIWRVGDGSQIRIWDDPWIPVGVTRRPRTPRGATLLTRVAELIDPVTGSWDDQLVRDLFWEEDVANILAIPIRPHNEDHIAWHFDEKGCFSVKSAYHVLADAAERSSKTQQGETSAQGAGDSKDDLWRRLWRLNC